VSARSTESAVDRSAHRLVRLYPRAWRVRYGDELADLLRATSGGRVPWRIRLDVAVGASREWLRGAGPPRRRRLGGALVVLCAWSGFVFAGVAMQRLSEHWQATTPAGSRAVPAAAFDVLLAAAAAGSALVLVGVALALPAALRLLRAGVGAPLRRTLSVALVPTVAAMPVAVALALWSRHLGDAQRNGGDVGYGLLALTFAVLFAGSLVAWTVAAVRVARLLDLSERTLRLEAALAHLVTGAMAVITVATSVWWAALAAASSPAARPLDARLAVTVALMLTATLVGAAGSLRARQSA
jgi:hypothetical protein